MTNPCESSPTIEKVTQSESSSSMSTSKTASAAAVAVAATVGAENKEDVEGEVRVKKLIDMMLNYESGKRKSHTEPLVRKVDKFLKANTPTKSYINLAHVVYSHGGIEASRSLTPLMAACMINDVDVACLLLESGARLVSISSSHGLELAYAILRPKNLSTRQRKNRNELINLMINLMESDPEIRNQHKAYKYPIMSIIYESDMQCLELFLKRGLLDNIVRRQLAFDLSLRVPARDGSTNEAIITKLLTLKPHLNIIDSSDHSAIMRVNDTRLVDILVEHGANINMRNSRGLTALMLNAQESCDSGDLMVFKLIKCGANFSMADDVGKTALEYAKSTNSVIFLAICHLNRVYELFRKSSSQELHAKNQAALDHMFDEVKRIVEAHHKSPDNPNRVFILRQRFLNFPVRYADLYAMRQILDCLDCAITLLSGSLMRRHLFFLPYFLSADFLRKLYSDVINWWSNEKNLKIKGEPLGLVRERVAKSGSLVEKQQMDELMRVINENRRMAHNFHLNIQAHTNSVDIMNAFLPADYKRTFDSKEFDKKLEAHLSAFQNPVADILNHVFDS